MFCRALYLSASSFAAGKHENLGCYKLKCCRLQIAHACDNESIKGGEGRD
jgi:hypothetical protein